MPHSHPFGKSWAGDLFAASRAGSVLDVGAGAGMWHDFLHRRGAVPQWWTAVEVWEPYIDQFRLRERYDEVIVGDARTVAIPAELDLAIAGDVLEHMPQSEAEVLLDRLMRHSTHVLISVPVIHYEQGALEGNPFEVHLWHPTHEWAMDVLRPSAHVVGDVVGAYWRVV